MGISWPLGRGKGLKRHNFQQGLLDRLGFEGMSNSNMLGADPPGYLAAATGLAPVLRAARSAKSAGQVLMDRSGRNETAMEIMIRPGFPISPAQNHPGNCIFDRPSLAAEGCLPNSRLDCNSRCSDRPLTLDRCSRRSTDKKRWKGSIGVWPLLKLKYVSY